MTATGAALPLPYDEVTDHRFAQDAARDFRVVESVPGMKLLSGPCPRCAAVIEVPVVDALFGGSRSFDSVLRRLRAVPGPAGSTPASRVEPMMCLCTEAHPGRPPSRTGCGAYWTLLIEQARP